MSELRRQGYNDAPTDTTLDRLLPWSKDAKATVICQRLRRQRLRRLGLIPNDTRNRIAASNQTEMGVQYVAATILWCPALTGVPRL
jgi:hypothetical protein